MTPRSMIDRAPRLDPGDRPSPAALAAARDEADPRRRTTRRVPRRDLDRTAVPQGGDAA